MEVILLNFFLVFIFGSIFGFSELLNRYPISKYIFKVWQSYLYIFLNGLISIFALLLIKHFRSEELNQISKIEINNIIIAGIGGMMILRSSIFSVKHRGEKVDIGLGTIAQIFLDSVEKNIVNNSAPIRFEEIEKLMEGIDFDKAKNELSTLCISSIDNFSKEDADMLTKEIENLSNLDILNKNKSLILGKNIALHCDTKILEKAIAYLGDSIKIGSVKIESEKAEDIDDWIEKLNKKQ